MLMMTRVDGSVDDEELTRMRWIVCKLFGDTLSEAEMRTFVASKAPVEGGIAAYLQPLEPQLGAAQKRQLLKVAFAIASADGRVVDAEDAMLVRIARALGVEPEAYRNVLTHAMVAREFL